MGVFNLKPMKSVLKLSCVFACGSYQSVAKRWVTNMWNKKNDHRYGC